jgi:hypothetical protein
MGSTDQPPQWKIKGVPQEIVAVVKDSSPEATEGILDLLRQNEVCDDRVTARWDTWKGVYFTPPDDELPWTQEEFDKINGIIEIHPNVQRTDTSPASGSAG